MSKPNAYRTPSSTNNDSKALLTCPYDKNHKISAMRFPYHISICRKNHPTVDLATCPFNERHMFPRPKLNYHVTVCPDRRIIEQDMLYDSLKQKGDASNYKGCTDVPSYTNTYQPPPCSENWEEDVQNERTFDYDPPERLSQIYRNTSGMTPSEKRAHKEYLIRQEERRKLGLPPEPERFSHDSKPPALIPSSKQGPLRLPREPPKTYQQVSQTAIGGQQLGLIGLGRGMLMNKQIKMVSQIQAEEARKDGKRSPSPQGFGRGMAANFGNASNQTNGKTDASEAKMYIRMVGRGRGGTPQLRNKNAVPSVGGLADQHAQNGDAVCIPESTRKSEKVIKKEEKVSQPLSIDDSSQDESEDVIRKKLIRKLTKKLNGIQNLEKKKEDGKELTEEEELKIGKKSEVVNLLNQLT
ncbi:uncharacterized protein [Antedon mediterranea]|uniref:uncharacterized protein isoform X2 n=1 Tax=Antedon mediterranea TaxID=105859 RepID=UPI003AF6D05A